MSKNYIEIDENIIKIHKDGKLCTLTNPNSIKILLDICHKNNFYFKSKKATLRNADKVIREFDSYRANKTEKKKKLNIAYNNIKKLINNSKLVRMNPIEKTVLVTGLATTIAFTAMAFNNNSNNKSDKNYIAVESQSIIEELPEYVDEEVVTETPIINIQDESFNYNTENEDGIIIHETETNDTYEINQMLEEDEFHFSYKDRTDSENLSNAKRYEDLFIKYGNMYGVDPNLLMAIAAQESSGDHYSHLSGGCAMGIMQIEKSVWIGHSVSAYNFETGEIDKIKVTEEAIEDLETNIQIGAMICINRIGENNYNIAIGTQGYNYGPGNMDKVFSSFSYDTGITKNDLRDDYSNIDWLKYRDAVSVGDQLYVEHVFSYIENGTVLTTKTRDGNTIELKIVNDQVNEKQMA